MLTDLRNYIMSDVDVSDEDINNNLLARATVLLLEKTPLIEFSKRLEHAFVENGRKLCMEIGNFSLFDNLSCNPHIEDFLNFDGDTILRMILSCYTDDYKLEIGNAPAIDYYLYLINEDEHTECERYVRDFIEDERGISETIRNEIKRMENPEEYLDVQGHIGVEETTVYCYVQTQDEELKELLSQLWFTQDPYDWMTFATVAQPDYFMEADINFDTDSLFLLIEHLETLPSRRKVGQRFKNILMNAVEGVDEPYLLYIMKNTTFESNEEVLF